MLMFKKCYFGNFKLCYTNEHTALLNYVILHILVCVIQRINRNVCRQFHIRNKMFSNTFQNYVCMRFKIMVNVQLDIKKNIF